MNQPRAVSLAAPIIFGLFPIGVTFGLLGYQQGLSFLFVVSLSVFVYAGASQFVLLGLLAEGIATPFHVFLTVWLVNLRHVILSLAFLPHTKRWSALEKGRFFPFLTDETFAVLSMSATARANPKTASATTLVVYAGWCTATAVGFAFGSFFPDPKRLGLDFALTAMFLGILILFIRRVEHLVSLLGAVGLTLFFYYAIDLGRASIVLAAVLASFLGSGLEWKRTSRS